MELYSYKPRVRWYFNYLYQIVFLIYTTSYHASIFQFSLQNLARISSRVTSPRSMSL